MTTVWQIPAYHVERILADDAPLYSIHSIFSDMDRTGSSQRSAVTCIEGRDG